MTFWLGSVKNVGVTSTILELFKYVEYFYVCVKYEKFIYCKGVWEYSFYLKYT